MHFDRQDEITYCSRTGGLKLGRIYESHFNFRMAGNDNSRFAYFMEKIKTIPNLEVIAAGGVQTFYSIRLPKSLLEKVSEVQELVNAIQQVPTDNKVEKAITTELITTIINLTGYKLMILPKPIEDPTLNIHCQP